MIYTFLIDNTTSSRKYIIYKGIRTVDRRTLARQTVACGDLLVWTLARADTHSEQVSIRANVRAQLSGEQVFDEQLS